MLRRLLNIASIVCVLAYVACMGMWIRSYRSFDILHGRFTDNDVFTFKSVSGRLQLLVDDLRGTQIKDWPWRIETHQMNDKSDFAFPPRGSSLLVSFGFELHPSPKHLRLFVPFWFFVLASGSLALALKMKWPPRFTLRALFFATTFLAIVLGMIAWLDRAWIGK